MYVVFHLNVGGAQRDYNPFGGLLIEKIERVFYSFGTMGTVALLLMADDHSVKQSS